MTTRFNKPPFFVARIVNPVMNLLVRMGLKPSGANTLIVKGRTSGKNRSMPVNPLDYEGKRYLVAPRGTTNWVRNLRAAGNASLRGGRKTVRIEATEVPVDQRAPIIRAYLDHWGITAREFDVSKDATVADIESIAAYHPVFEIRETSSAS